MRCTTAILRKSSTETLNLRICYWEQTGSWRSQISGGPSTLRPQGTTFIDLTSRGMRRQYVPVHGTPINTSFISVQILADLMRLHAIKENVFEPYGLILLVCDWQEVYAVWHARLSSSRDDRGQNPRRESGPLEPGRSLLWVSGRESSFRDEEPRRNVPQNLQGKREESPCDVMNPVETEEEPTVYSCYKTSEKRELTPFADVSPNEMKQWTGVVL